MLNASGWAFSISSKQHHAVRPAAHRLGQLAAFLIADIARRRTDQAADIVALHELAHVELDQRLFAAEHELGQRLGQQRLAHAGRAQEDEAADRPPWIFQSGPGPAHGLGDGLDRLFLADDALVHHPFHLQQALALLAGDAADRHARPHRDHLGDVLGVTLGWLVASFQPSRSSLSRASSSTSR